MDKETRLDMIELTRGYLGVFLMAILMNTGIITAMYAGESQTFPNEMGIENLVYAIVGNSTPIFPEVAVNSTNITIYLPQDSVPNNFTMVFIEKETETVVQTIYTGGGGGGGSSRIKYVDRNITKNIPIYTDVEVIKEVPVEKIVEVPGEVIEDKISLWFWIFIIILAVLITWAIAYLINKNNLIEQPANNYDVYKKEEPEYG